MQEFHANYQLTMAKLSPQAMHDYSNAFKSLLEQVDAIKVQFIQVTNNIREKRG